MPDHVYKKIELTGTSGDSIEDAVNKAIKKASQTVRQLRWFTLEEVRGIIDGDEVDTWQATIKVGFTLED